MDHGSVKFSVIVCTHNPRPAYLARTMAGLRAQSVPPAEWELIIVDNASAQPVRQIVEVDWHPQARIVLEERLGLTNARLRGIDESRADLIIFVDDDNVLANDYCAIALQLAHDFPAMGAWSGQSVADFDGFDPPAWSEPYWPMLVIRTFSRDAWTNQDDWHCCPCGAGLVVRRQIAEKYRQVVTTDPLRRFLDRQGGSLISGGDTDLALTAVDEGLGMGRFASLKLRHLMPPERFQEEYLLRLVEGIHCSMKLLRSIRGRVAPERRTLVQRLRRLARQVLGSADERAFRFGLAEERGRAAADRILAEFAAQRTSTRVAPAQSAVSSAAAGSKS